MVKFCLILPLFFASLQLSAQKVIYADIEKTLQTQLIMAEVGDTIDIPAGHFKSAGTLSLDDKEDIVIRGAGMDQTVISFKDQKDGAEGLRISNARNITVQNLTLQDASGDLLKAINTDGLFLRNVKTEWTGRPKKKNGAYGLYPVSCQNVMIDGCVAIGASDAGIYVGQSHNIVVRNSTAHHNVAGIEIENSTLADVYDCRAYQNTGGILIFDLPDLPVKAGGNVRVYGNEVFENDYRNFAPKGNVVGTIPPGTGIMILATNNVEVFENNIRDNRTASLAIVSYDLVAALSKKPLTDTAYYPYPTSIYVHDNTFERGKRRPTFKNKMGLLLWMKFKRQVPHILFDGITDPATVDEAGNLLPEYQICIRNNTGASFADLDAENDFDNIETGLEAYDCSREALEEPKFSQAR